jgi:hypothetical protein
MENEKQIVNANKKIVFSILNVDTKKSEKIKNNNNNNNYVTISNENKEKQYRKRIINTYIKKENIVDRNVNYKQIVMIVKLLM